ncbi:microcin C ABC transporter permease YejB [Escherichia coli]|nr:microcin C ABC transporter permease YejB [Escherichia coli]
MGAYLIRRLLLVIPTLWAIITINFFIVQIAPGGPVDQAIAAIEFGNAGVLPGAGGEGIRASHAQTGVGNISDSNYRGGRGLDPEVIAEITHRYGFDKPIHERYFKMLWDYIRFDFGDSLFRSASVLTLIKDSLPVSITLGLWSTLIIYLVSIPLGIRKAVYNGSRFDVWSSAFIIIGYAIPAFLFAILLIVFFAGGSYFDLFPLRGLVSANFDSLPWYQKITDYLWHITLPVLATVIGGFAALTMLTKNSFLDEVRKQYVVTARAKGVSEKNILWKHVFRNAMLLVIAGFPATFISMFFTGSLLIEVMFSLNGLGLLGYEATVSRDYPVMFGTLYIFTLIGLMLTLCSSVMGVLAGALQGYYGGKVDLWGQRFIEVWSGMPTLFLIILLSSVVQPNFWWLLAITVLFGWMSLVGVVRAEFLRTRNFDYIRAAQALGVSDRSIILRHMLPNAMVATLTFLPFILCSSITTLTSLDFLGFGLPLGSPSLGELLLQGKNNLQAPWLGITAFLSVAILLSLLIFIGEAVRDAFDPNKAV